MSEHVWVKRSTLETIEARLNNIKIKYSKLAKKASVKPYGRGTGAGINITLPKSSGGGAAAGVYLYKIVGGSGGAYTIELYNERTDDASKKIGTGTLMFTMKHISDNLKTDGTIWGVCNAKQCSVLNITPA